jgi:hypothetical protein
MLILSLENSFLKGGGIYYVDEEQKYVLLKLQTIGRTVLTENKNRVFTHLPHIL